MWAGVSIASLHPLLSYLGIVRSAVVAASSGCMRSRGRREKGIGRFPRCCARPLEDDGGKDLLAPMERVTAVMGGKSLIVILAVGYSVSLADEGDVSMIGRASKTRRKVLSVVE